MKLLLIPKDKEEIFKADAIVDGFIIGIENLSTNLPGYFTLEDVKEIRKVTDKEIFISLNKNMHSFDLPLLKNILLELEKLDIEGILYYDVSIVNIKQELNLKNELVWNGEHLVTNSLSCDFWKENGVGYAYLSSDITKEEILKISKETSMHLMINVFGYVPIFTSYRHLIKNYLKTFSLTDNSSIHYILKEGKKYPITDYINTTVYSNHILSVFDSYLELSNLAYGVINSFNLDIEVLLEIINMFKTVNDENKEEYSKKINSYFPNIDDGFLNKETIYRVIK